jgi:hypothetical protein
MIVSENNKMNLRIKLEIYLLGSFFFYGVILNGTDFSYTDKY